jgi:hydrogenase 3 maturation protease
MFSDVKMIRDLLKERLKGVKRLLVIGVGNELGCDDAAGVDLAKQLKKGLHKSRRASVIEAGATPENFTSVVNDFHPSHIVIVDAAKMGLQPGSVRIVEKAEITGFSYSTHTLPLSFLIGLLEKSSGAVITVIGIEPLCVGFGERISRPVRVSITSLIRVLQQIINSMD